MAKKFPGSQFIPKRTAIMTRGDIALEMPNISANKRLLQEKPEWDDQQVQLGAVGFGSSAPTWTDYKGGEVLAFNKAQDNKIVFNVQLTHAYKIGTDIEFHAHVVHPDGGAGTSRWKFTYSWAKLGSAFPAESTAYANVSNSGADVHQYADIKEDITPTETDMGVSSMLICSLTREGTDLSDTYENDVYLVGLDFHILKDSVGSLLETQKI